MINRNFFMLLSGQFVSQIGDKLHMIALSFWVLKTTGSSAKMGAVLAASLIPSLVVGFFSGAFIDRYNRKNIIIGTDLLRGLILALFAVLFYFELINFYMILAMQVLLSVNAAFFDPAIPSVIPQIVNEKYLAAANSKHQFVNGFSTIAGAFIGGIFISMFGYLWVFVANAISFLLSAFFECFIKIPPLQKDTTEKRGEAGIISDLKQGYQYILSDKALLILLFMVMIIHFFVGSMEIFMPVIANAISDDGARNLGFFQTAFGVGTVIMAVILSIKNISGKEKFTLFGSVFLIGVLYIAASFFAGNEAVITGLYLIMIFLFGCCIICAGISFKTLLQKKVDNNFAGRVFAVVGSVGNASIPGAMIAYGFLLEIYDFQDLLMISGLVLIPLSIISFILYKEAKHVRATEVLSKSLT
ncbi:MAG: MFS transporter [Desulfobacteraceae bacterium]|nr:MFS transporter [Desulfobacteraceae bacterium]